MLSHAPSSQLFPLGKTAPTPSTAVSITMADRLTQLQDAIDDVSLTKTPTCPTNSLTQFLTQCYASLIYNFHHAPYADIPTQPNQAPPTASFSDSQLAPASASTPAAPALTNGNTSQQTQQTQSQSQSQQQQKTTTDSEPPKDRQPADEPHSRAEHTASLRELAQGLVLKEQQIEYLVQSLPGIGSSERDQERRIRELQEELRVVEQERREKEVVRESLVEGLGTWIVGGRRVP